MNNLYFAFCDPRICMDTRYIDCLREPKRQYLSHITGRVVAPVEAIEETIDQKLSEAGELYRINAGRKLNLSWNEFKGFVQQRLMNILDNYVSPDWESNSFVNHFEF